MALDIALPFYGDVDLMKQTVLSVIHQTDPNWRLIVVDDGYPDDSIPEWFAGLKDSRIEYQRNVNNLGANGNFQKCLGLVSSDYCVVMGADDLLEPNYVKTINMLTKQHPEAEIIHPGVEIIDESNHAVAIRSDQIKRALRPSSASVKVLEGESLATSLMRGNWMYFPSMAWKTKRIQEVGFRPGFDVCQDLGLAMDLIMQGGTMLLVDDVLFRYRRHMGSDSSVKAINGDRFVDEKKFFKEMSKDLSNIGWKQAARAANLHWTSRLHAASLIPKSIKARKSPTKLLKHLFT